MHTAEERRQKFHFCRLPFVVNVMLNLSISSLELLEAQLLLRDLLSFCFTLQSRLAPSKSSLLNRAVRSRPVKETRWLTGITGYTLKGMLRQYWFVVKVRPFS